MAESRSDYQDARLLSKVLTLYYTENLSQSEIARQMDLSIAKVNRTLQAARRQGMVEIKIHTPFEHIFELEKAIEETSLIHEAIVVPKISDNPEALLHEVGRVAAEYLLNHLHENSIVAMGGGRALSATVNALPYQQKHSIQLVPAIGGVQGQYFTDVNNLVAEAARRLGGSSLQMHAPAYTDTEIERNILYSSRQVKDVLDLARQADIALVGIGTLVVPGLSSYLSFHNMNSEELNEINQVYHGVAEILSQAIDAQGIQCAPKYSQRVIGLKLDELRQIPLAIGVAAAPHKTIPVAAALKGRFLKTIIIDEETAEEVIELLSK